MTSEEEKRNRCVDGQLIAELFPEVFKFSVCSFTEIMIFSAMQALF
jgi:hypothetical protein